MNHALVQNALIVAVVIIGLVTLQNPLCILGLLLMSGLPFGLMAGRQQLDDEEDEAQPMGFTAELQ